MKYRFFEVINNKLRVQYATYDKRVLVIILIESNERLIKEVEDLK